MNVPFTLECDLERRICASPEWQAGAVWGKPRPGHGEGPVIRHVADVLANVDLQATTPEERQALRLIALIHDNFKYRIDATQPRVGENHHAMRARRFAERYLSDASLLDIIELHDAAYHCWRVGHLTANWTRAEARAERLLARLGAAWSLYLRFYRCDNATPFKAHAPVAWFERFLRARGYAVPEAPGGAHGSDTFTARR
ncbi:MAG: hypothetical protein IVW57_04715 [Ktedonobacterales bacterium]|nr:hypothetical protein [Ktedonobacterales bacterium]